MKATMNMYFRHRFTIDVNSLCLRQFTACRRNNFCSIIADVGVNSSQSKLFSSLSLVHTNENQVQIDKLQAGIQSAYFLRNIVQKRYFKTEGDFHLKADSTLEHIQECIEDSLNDNLEEAVLASGVLTFETPRGIWVLNKQTPNRQIWWSSPISGPRRYEYIPETNDWVNTRDGIGLYDSLKEEMLEVFGKEIDI